MLLTRWRCSMSRSSSSSSDAYRVKTTLWEIKIPDQNILLSLAILDDDTIEIWGWPESVVVAAPQRSHGDWHGRLATGTWLQQLDVQLSSRRHVQTSNTTMQRQMTLRNSDKQRNMVTQRSLRGHSRKGVSDLGGHSDKRGTTTSQTTISKLTCSDSTCGDFSRSVTNFTTEGATAAVSVHESTSLLTSWHHGLLSGSSLLLVWSANFNGKSWECYL